MPYGLLRMIVTLIFLWLHRQRKLSSRRRRLGNLRSSDAHSGDPSHLFPFWIEYRLFGLLGDGKRFAHTLNGPLEQE